MHDAIAQRVVAPLRELLEDVVAARVHHQLHQVRLHLLERSAHGGQGGVVQELLEHAAARVVARGLEEASLEGAECGRLLGAAAVRGVEGARRALV